MALEEEDKKNEKDTQKYRTMVKMLSFRIVPAYYKELENVAATKKMSVSKLIRSYIKEGMVRDGELTKTQQQQFKV